MQKITPHLWFDKNAEEAANFYLSVFGDGQILGKTYYPDAGKEIHGMDAGTVLTVSFSIRGFNFVALNGGPVFKINPSISFTVVCSSVEEVEELGRKLIDGGEALMPIQTYPFSERYGWIKDKFDVTWQLIYIAQAPAEKIFPSLMYTGEQAGKAEEAMNFYASIFPDSEVGEIYRYSGNEGVDKAGTVMHAGFKLFGQKFSAMDSSHEHKFNFNEAVSLLVTCNTQEEIDNYWNKLSAVPEAEQCGWLKDKYGVSWQIAPSNIEKYLNSGDSEKGKKAMEAFLKMKKIDIKKLEEAANS